MINWEKAIARAERELAMNKVRINSAPPSGTSSDRILRRRGYDLVLAEGGTSTKDVVST